MIDKLKRWILPETIDFFGSLSQQSAMTSGIITELGKFYTENPTGDAGHILEMIQTTRHMHSANLQALNSTFITPVDREALSRAYSHLNWVALSAKHLVVETRIYGLFDLTQYKNLFALLKQEADELTSGFQILNDKDYPKVIQAVAGVIRLDDQLIEAYARALGVLFQQEDANTILLHREIIAQLKEISKRIHICANLLEDIVFKLS